ncbi:alpha/beta fold hydrolase [Roseomonas sp. BU-1]|uniref:Alpha/beta fold hydrolase n=2 Tax=Falsiroseomonas selenitidurans TaxID=2716335 RepID=A0ABX1E606_9PROT|nr:alpha/beta fold hydrolase [Falsiroseomonas selenitidurans]
MALLLAGCVAAPPASSPAALERDLLAIPVPGTGQAIAARLCRPELPRTGPVPLAVINHGSPADAAARPRMRPAACGAEAVRWFTDRGFAVLLPLRRGYGVSGGAWAESNGRCAAPDFAGAGRQGALDVAAAVEYGRRLPGIRPEGVLVVGQSAGGWAALALAADRPEGVAAVIAMAPGRGGWAGGQPGRNCAPERLVAAAGEFGRSARLPVLWVATANDSFFSPSLAAAMQDAFTRAGGQAALVALPAWGADGHSLFFGAGGSATWGPIVERFLRSHGYGARQT